MAGNGLDSPSYGRRLIPQILDQLAASQPERVVYSVASCATEIPSFHHISARMFCKAVDKTAWWLQGQLDALKQAPCADANANRQVLPKIQPLGYIGPRNSFQISM